MRPGRFELPRSKRTTRPSTLRATCPSFPTAAESRIPSGILDGRSGPGGQCVCCHGDVTRRFSSPLSTHLRRGEGAEQGRVEQLAHAVLVEAAGSDVIRGLVEERVQHGDHPLRRMVAAELAALLPAYHQLAYGFEAGFVRLPAALRRQVVSIPPNGTLAAARAAPIAPRTVSAVFAELRCRSSLGARHGSGPDGAHPGATRPPRLWSDVLRDGRDTSKRHTTRPLCLQPSSVFTSGRRAITTTCRRRCVRLEQSGERACGHAGRISVAWRASSKRSVWMRRHRQPARSVWRTTDTDG